MSGPYLYDVAFSFLQRDEALATQLNDRLQDRVRTFLYTEQQNVVAGTDGGETFNRVFAVGARMVVVLYRDGWGDSGWTQVEQTAIRNRAFEEGFDFCKFIPLDDPPHIPQWVPRTQLWIGLERYGVDGAAAAIDSRITELGGQPHKETVSEHAARLARDMDFKARREEFRGDEGVKTAHDEMPKLRRSLQEIALRVSAETPRVRLELWGNDFEMYIVGLGRSLGLKWQQPYGNSLNESTLEVRLFNMPPARPGNFRFEQPKILRSMKFAFDLLPSRESGWITKDSQQRAFSTPSLSEFLAKFYLEHGRHD